MAIVLDTDKIDARDRAEVMATAVQQLSAPAHLVHDPADGPVRAYFEAWEFGQVCLHRTRMSGFHLVRTPKQIRLSPSSLLSLAIQGDRSSCLTQADVQYETSPGDLFMVDLAVPYQLVWRGGTVTALVLQVDQLGLSPETVTAAPAHLRRSPIYPLFANHLALMGESADLLHDDTATKQLGDSCLEMIRTLLLSAAALGNEDTTALPTDILLAQIRSFVRRRLSDPDLNAPTIARAHSISLRYLYQVWSGTGPSLEQWIIAERLDRVHSDLAREDTRHRSIAAIAYSHGFRHPSHFTRRFRIAYGITPTEWRRAALESPVDTATVDYSLPTRWRKTPVPTVDSLPDLA
ncbi:helix-turn-helix domain-containing protein [Nocardia ninae]|nr:helix-turn-helix domain-containing protein [Nocardia ninae]